MSKTDAASWMETAQGQWPGADKKVGPNEVWSLGEMLTRAMDLLDCALIPGRGGMLWQSCPGCGADHPEDHTDDCVAVELVRAWRGMEVTE